MSSFFKSVLAWALGSFFGVGLFALIIIGIVAGSVDSSDVVVRDNSVLRINLSRAVTERPITDPFQKALGRPSGTGLNQLIYALKKAKKDDKIQGVYIEVGGPQIGLASLEALRVALADFKTSKKFIYAYGELYTEKDFYLASLADSLFVYPTGFMEWNGLNANPMFYKGLLEKLEVEPKVFRVGTFKSAVEPFIQKEMSPANREQYTTILNDFWRHMITEIAVARRLNADTLDRLASRFTVESGKDAIRYRLLDRTAYQDEVEKLLRAKTKTAEAEKIRYVDILEYARYHRAKDDAPEDSDKQVAVVYAVGDINSGKGDDESIGSESLVKELRAARLDKNVKAVVLRVNSPGGSALASDVIAREIELIKAKKPIYASFGDVAASGGYYISAKCDRIYAEPTTITGSIGVFGLLANTQKMFNNKLGITFDRVYSSQNQYADLGDPNRPMTDYEAQKIQNGVNKVYGEFIQTVLAGRKQFADSAAVDAVAQGRIWSGKRALELKLVDELGGLDAAVEGIAQKAGLGDDYAVVEFPKAKSAIDKLLSMGEEEKDEAKAQLQWFAQLDPRFKEVVRVARMLQEKPGVFVRLPVDLDIR
jgi:protease-4